MSTQRPPEAKRRELLALMGSVSLQSMFRGWGRAVGAFPSAFLISGFILVLMSAGMMSMNFRDNVRDGYTPSTSRSRLETKQYRAFLNSQGDPVMTTVLMLARDGGSMHRLEYLQEAVQQMVYISKNLSVTSPDGRAVTYSNFCGHYCEANSVLSALYLSLSTEEKNGPQLRIRITYPIADMRDNLVHLERNLFGVETTDGDGTNGTNIKHVELISMPFLAEVKTQEDLDLLGKWELEVFKYCEQYSKYSDDIELVVIGAEIVDTEMNKDGRRMAPYFAIGVFLPSSGFSLMLVFIFTTTAVSAKFFGRLNYKVIFVGLACAFVPVASITTTMGLTSLLGQRINSLMLIMPFLIMGIGVNDAFLTVHAWLRSPSSSSLSVRMGGILEEVGPSITTTTLTNVVTFTIGWFNPTEEISIFCLGSAIALFFAYIFTVIIFVPILCFCTVNTGNEYGKDGIHKDANEKRRSNRVVNLYCAVVASKPFLFILLIACGFYWYYGVAGTMAMTAKLDTGKILPRETPILRPNRLVENLVWKEYYPVTVIVNSAIDISEKSQKERLEQFVEQFEMIPSCKGAQFTMFWLRDYIYYYYKVAPAESDFDYDDALGDTKDEEEFGFSKLSGFLAHPMYSHHKSFLHTDYNQDVPVRNFSFVVVYENNTSWEDRIWLMQRWREQADSAPEMNVSVWNVNAMFVDQMLSLKSLTLQTCLVTLACMAVVCILFIQNPLSVLLATLSIASISLGVMGYLSWWALDLDPVSLCAVLISIGMAVDFVAHTTYHYQLPYEHRIEAGVETCVALKDHDARLRHMICNIAWPMSQGGVSTVLCILPLTMLMNYIPLVFVKTIFLVVLWGLVHGLVLLPAVLSQMPLSWLDFNILHYILGTRPDNEMELNLVTKEQEMNYSRADHMHTEIEPLQPSVSV